MRQLVRGAGVLCCALAGACVQADPAGPAPATDDLIQLRVLDARGAESDRSAIPRRPQLQLTHPHGLQPDAETVVLLSGTLDEALLEDLEAAPLRSEHAARLVPCALTQVEPDGALRLAPVAPLDRGATYTLAVTGNARDAAGERLFMEARPWLLELRTERGPDGGARVTSTWPADGAAAVATNLASALVALDGHVDHARDGAWLEGPDGLAVPASIESEACASLAPELGGESCIRLTPDGLLAPSAPYAIVLGAAALDAHGAPVGPFRASFRSASGPDRAAPLLRTPSCAIDEQATRAGCALVDDESLSLRVAAGEPTFFTLTTDGAVARAAAANGEAVLQLSGLAADRAYALTLELRDAAGNAAQERLELRTEPLLPALAIVELRADPLGPEPAQELVELLNYGSRAIALQGFTLGDRLDAPGTAIGVEATVPPAGRAVLVPDAFDPREPSEPQPAEGALLVRAGKALGSGGLRNSGEALYLRTPDGRRISAAPATPRPRAGDCVVRVSDDMRTGEPAAFDYAGEAGCTPGW